MISNCPIALVSDNLDNYIFNVNSIPLLTAEEEKHLSNLYKKHKNLKAAHTLVLSNLRVVIFVSKQYLGYGISHADLIQEGNIGLMKAVKKYDPDKGVRLISYAIYWIKAEIHEYIIKNWRLVKIATTKAQRKLFFCLRSNCSRLGSLSCEEIKYLANLLNVKPRDVQEMESRLTNQDISIESNGTEEEDDRFFPIQWLSDTRYEPIEMLSNNEYRKLQIVGIEGAIQELDLRSQKIIRARWLDTKENGQSNTLHDLAKEFNISAERIRQIEIASFKKMKIFLSKRKAFYKFN